MTINQAMNELDLLTAFLKDAAERNSPTLNDAMQAVFETRAHLIDTSPDHRNAAALLYSGAEPEDDPTFDFKAEDRAAAFHDQLYPDRRRGHPLDFLRDILKRPGYRVVHMSDDKDYPDQPHWANRMFAERNEVRDGYSDDDEALESDRVQTELLGNPDGRVWAEEWFKIAQTGVEVDIDWMTGWFSNAIEAGRNAGRKETDRALSMDRAGISAELHAWDRRLKALRCQVDLASAPGNADANDYLRGMANGAIMALATMTDQEPVYIKEGPQVHPTDLEWGVEKPTHYVLFNGAGYYAKEAEFFVNQGGLREPWGTNWKPVIAKDIEHARAIAKTLTWGADPGPILTPNEPSSVAKLEAMHRALKDWMGEVFLETAEGRRKVHPDGTPNLGKHEAEQLYRTATAYFDLPQKVNKGPSRSSRGRKS